MSDKKQLASILEATQVELPKEEDQLTSREKKLEMMLNHAFTKDNIEMKTDINTAQIVTLTKLQLYGDIYNCGLAYRIAERLMVLSISKNRLGRKELTEMTRGATDDLEGFNPISKRLLGM